MHLHFENKNDMKINFLLEKTKRKLKFSIASHWFCRIQEFCVFEKGLWSSQKEKGEIQY